MKRLIKFATLTQDQFDGKSPISYPEITNTIEFEDGYTFEDYLNDHNLTDSYEFDKIDNETFKITELDNDNVYYYTILTDETV